MVEFVPEMKTLIAEINEVLARGVKDSFNTFHNNLSTDNAALFQSLPKPMKLQLLLDRDAHGATSWLRDCCAEVAPPTPKRPLQSASQATGVTLTCSYKPLS